MSHYRVRHLVLDTFPEPLSYYSGINSGDVYLEPDEEVNFFSVILREGQYSQFGSAYSAVGAIAQMEDGRIYTGEIISSETDSVPEEQTSNRTFKLKMEIMPRPNE